MKTTLLWSLIAWLWAILIPKRISDLVTLKNDNSCYYSLACQFNIFLKPHLLMIDDLCSSSRYNRGNNSKLGGHSETKDQRWGTLYYFTGWYGLASENTHTPMEGFLVCISPPHPTSPHPSRSSNLPSTFLLTVLLLTPSPPSSRVFSVTLIFSIIL